MYKVYLYIKDIVYSFMKIKVVKMHIACILLTLFNRIGRGLFDEGRVFIAIPPLFRVSTSRGNISYIDTKDDVIKFKANRAAKVVANVLMNDGTELPTKFVSFILKFGEKLFDAINQLEKEYHIPAKMLDKILSSSLIPDLTVDFDAKEIINTYLKQSAPVFFKEFESGFYSGLFEGEYILYKPDENLSIKLQKIAKYLNQLIGRIDNNRHFTVNYNYADECSVYNVYKYLNQESTKGIDITYLKGLGEMKPEELAKTTINPKTRRMYKICMTDDALCQETFEKFMSNSKPSIRFRAGIITENFGIAKA